MRMNLRIIFSAILMAGTCFAAVPRAGAQDSEQLMPDESAAKAKAILQETIQALGGAVFLNVHDSTCTLRMGQFGHSGDLNGYAKYIDYIIPPDKDRTENVPKGNIISLMNGNKGWTLDRGGVSEEPETDIAQNQDDVLKDIDNILRLRIKEPGMIFRYGGPDVVDLQEADWVELVDSENRTYRIAVAKSTHLPIRKETISRDAASRRKTDEIEYYSNYHPIEGIETPFQITRERNGRKVYQVFIEKCDYNTNLSPAFFTRESLEERWAKVGKKERKKDKDKN
ncbi:MAG: hypothetical protein ACRD5M_17505 [Candidatus Acidiferrales bacterium]